MPSWKDAEVQLWFKSMLLERIPSLITFALLAFDSLYAKNYTDFLTIFLLSILVIVLFSEIGRLKENKARFRAAFVYYQAIQILILAQSVLSPTVVCLHLYLSGVVMIQHELTPLHGLGVNCVIVVKNTIAWAILLRYENLRFDVNFLTAIFWLFFHMFNYLQVRKQTFISLFQSLQLAQREEQRLQSLLQAIPDGVCVVTSQSQVVAYNQAIMCQLGLYSCLNANQGIEKALRSLEYVSDLMERKIAGNVLDDLLAFIDRNDALEDSKGVVRLGSGIYELRAKHTKWDSTPACVVIVRDITHWISLKQNAQRESAGKTALLRSVSHELRTPTNAILNFTREILEKEQLTDAGVESLHMITSSTAFLLSIINDLLDYSRIVTGNFHLTNQPCKLQEIVNDCMKLVQHQCHAKGLRLALFYDSLLPDIVNIDPTRVKQVLLNLLSNALKFTLKGYIEVSAWLNAQGKLSIRVKDSGIGIPTADIGKIFRLFGKLDGNEHLNPQGCGLGLSISNHIVESLGGGPIFVLSNVGKGSIFSFNVDIGLTSDEVLPTGDPITDITEDDSPGINSPLISLIEKEEIRRLAQVLIVDDSDFNRIIVKRLIENRGFACEEAVTGLQALDKVRDRTERGEGYKLILMDIEMPEMDGITATREIRGLRALREQPLIVGCSAYSASEDRERSLAAGMDHYLEKPLQRELLYELLTQILA